LLQQLPMDMLLYLHGFAPVLGTLVISMQNPTAMANGTDN